jgi:uncharacterized membrane protein YeaQ/YmgE (transglycosylase-associated protein family)
MSTAEVGGLVFGLVIGWITYRTLRRTTEPVGLSSIATVVGAVGGGAVTTVFHTPKLFGWYSIGLGIGFFAYLVLGTWVFSDNTWLGGSD